jgi:DNA-binding CsgD family transcriptional regulator
MGAAPAKRNARKRTASAALPRPRKVTRSEEVRALLASGSRTTAEIADALGLAADAARQSIRRAGVEQLFRGRSGHSSLWALRDGALGVMRGKQ